MPWLAVNYKTKQDMRYWAVWLCGVQEMCKRSTTIKRNWKEFNTVRFLSIHTAPHRIWWCILEKNRTLSISVYVSSETSLMKHLVLARYMYRRKNNFFLFNCILPFQPLCLTAIITVTATTKLIYYQFHPIFRNLNKV